MEKRICYRCNQEKDLDQFGKDKYHKLGHTYDCKACRRLKTKEWTRNNPEKAKESNNKSREKRKEYYDSPERKFKYRKKFIERKFNISYEEYEKLQKQQDNKCKICGNKETHIDKNYLSVDHNHNTGEVRGLLCSRCNFGLGYFKDDIENLKNAIKYLNKEI